MRRLWNRAACGRRIGMCGYTSVLEDGRTCLNCRTFVTLSAHILKQFLNVTRPVYLPQLRLVFCFVIFVRCIVFSVSVCMSVCLSVRLHISQTIHPNFTEFSARVPVAVTRSSFDVDNGNTIRYVLPVLWMTSCFHITERITESETTRVR